MTKKEVGIAAKARVAVLLGYALLVIGVISTMMPFATRSGTPVTREILFAGNAFLGAVGAATAVLGKSLMAIEERIKRLENKVLS